jgi:uncharacterized protein (TIGR00369 family)
MTDASRRFEEQFNPLVAQAVKERSRTGYPGLLGISVDEVSPGRVVCSLAIRPDHCSAIGLLHGGAIASLIDHALSIVVFPLVEVGKWVATVEFKVNYISWVREGTVRAIASVESLRGHLAVVRVEVESDSEKVAVGQGTLYIRDRVKEGAATDSSSGS